jgi:hypothetical protein
MPMIEIPIEKVYELLGTRDISGSEKELDKLCIRIRELVESNGEDWIKANREKLLFEWDYIIQHKIIT